MGWTGEASGSAGKRDGIHREFGCAENMGDELLAGVNGSGARGDIFRVNHDRYGVGSGHSDRRSCSLISAALCHLQTLAQLAQGLKSIMDIDRYVVFLP